jgi:Cdc6-like AAA superfamily ATPase
MIGHTRFNESIEALDRIYQLANTFEPPQGVRIIGPIGSGKTSLINHFSTSLLKSTLFQPGFGAMIVRLNASPTRHQFVRNLLIAYGYPFSETSTKAIDIKTKMLINLILEKGTRLLGIDESHHMITSGLRRLNRPAAGDVSDTIHQIMDSTKVAVALLATDELDQLENIHPHLASRITARVELRNYETLDAEWYGILKAYIKQSLQFDLSTIITENYGALIHAATGGNLRNLKRLMTEIALICVDQNHAPISQSLLYLAHNRIHGTEGVRANPFTK